MKMNKSKLSSALTGDNKMCAVGEKRYMWRVAVTCPLTRQLSILLPSLERRIYWLIFRKAYILLMQMLPSIDAKSFTS